MEKFDLQKDRQTEVHPSVQLISMQKTWTTATCMQVLQERILFQETFDHPQATAHQ